MAGNLIAGTCYVTVAGTSVAIAGEGSYRVSSQNRESLIGQDGFHGFKAMPAAGRMSWTGRDGGNVSVQDLANMIAVTVVFELANGKVIIGQSMTRVGDAPAVNTEEATYDLEFEGPTVTEN